MSGQSDYKHTGLLQAFTESALNFIERRERLVYHILEHLADDIIIHNTLWSLSSLLSSSERNFLGG